MWIVYWNPLNRGFKPSYGCDELIVFPFYTATLGKSQKTMSYWLVPNTFEEAEEEEIYRYG